MFFRQRQDPLNILRSGDHFFDVIKGEKFLADDAAEAFGDLLLAFWEDAVEGEAKNLFGVAGMEQEFERHPDREPVNKGRNEGDGVEPPGQFRH